MANVKISELPAGAALSVADILALVQSGATKQVTAEQVRAFIGGGLQNRLINGEFAIWQRGTSVSAQADDTYGAMGDRWYILTQTSTIAGARQSNPFNGARFSGQLTQSQASAQRIGAAQIIEGKNCIDLRGQAVTFYGRFKISANQDVRFAILEWTGTEDAPTSDVVNDWTSSTYTAGNFFNSTTLTVTAVKEYASPGTGWVDFFITGTLGSSVNNLIVFAWTEGTAAQNVTFELANCGLVRGSAAPAAHRPRSFGEEVVLCQRYYQKSFELDTAPAENSGVTAGLFSYPQIAGAGGGGRGPFMSFPVIMRATPTVTTYNPSAANAQSRNFDASLDNSNLSVQRASPRGMCIQWDLNGGSASNQQSGVHWSAVAEL